MANSESRYPRTLKGHNKNINTLIMMSNYLVSGSDDAMVKLWNCDKDYDCVRTIMTSRGRIHSLVSLPNEDIAISSKDDNLIRVFGI
jgi:WD40 repeat protein